MEVKNNSINEKNLFCVIDMISSISSEIYYMIDLMDDKVCYISPNALYLFGNKEVEKQINGNNDKYDKVTCQTDLLLWKDLREAIVIYIKENSEKRDEIEYFSCALRANWEYSKLSKPLSLTLHHRMIPMWKEKNLRYLLCSVENSVTKKSGNLRVHFKNKLSCEIYNIHTNMWKKVDIPQFTERERAILILTKQGKKDQKIAEEFNISAKAISSNKTALYEKIGFLNDPTGDEHENKDVDKKMEAVSFASNYSSLIHLNCTQKPKTEQNLLPKTETKCKRTRKLITTDVAQSLQNALDAGKSIREAARMIEISESAVRYAIKRGVIDVNCAKK